MSAFARIGWVDFSGNDCPVNEHDYVEVQDSGGIRREGQAMMFRWNRAGAINVVAYRLIRLAKSYY